VWGGVGGGEGGLGGRCGVGLRGGACASGGGLARIRWRCRVGNKTTQDGRAVRRLHFFVQFHSSSCVL